MNQSTSKELKNKSSRRNSLASQLLSENENMHLYFIWFDRKFNFSKINLSSSFRSLKSNSRTHTIILKEFEYTRLFSAALTIFVFCISFKIIHRVEIYALSLIKSINQCKKQAKRTAVGKFKSFPLGNTFSLLLQLKMKGSCNNIERSEVVQS